jgi:Periplasmic binding protein-like domain
VRGLIEGLGRVRPTLLAAGGNSRESGRRAAGSALDRQNRPTALICLSDVLALGALDAMSDRGLVAGRDLSVTGFDDLPDALRAGLTTVHQPIVDKGRLVGELLLDPDRQPRRIMLDHSLVIRSSTGPAPRSRRPTTSPPACRREIRNTHFKETTMSQFLYVPVVENTRWLVCSALPGSPQVADDDRTLLAVLATARAALLRRSAPGRTSSVIRPRPPGGQVLQDLTRPLTGRSALSPGSVVPEGRRSDATGSPPSAAAAGLFLRPEIHSEPGQDHSVQQQHQQSRAQCGPEDGQGATQPVHQ